jgi:hypothetical protein
VRFGRQTFSKIPLAAPTAPANVFGPSPGGTAKKAELSIVGATLRKKNLKFTFDDRRSAAIVHIPLPEAGRSKRAEAM